MAKHETLVTNLYLKLVKPMGLPPRLAGEIKRTMMEAAKTSKGDKKSTKAAIKAYLVSKGYDPETGAKGDKPKKAKAPKAAKAKKAKKETEADDDDDDDEVEEKPKKKKSPTSDPAKQKLVDAGAKGTMKGDEERGVPEGNIDLTKLDRRGLKKLAKKLGSSYKKAMTDDEVRAEIAKTVGGLTPALVKKLKDADPAKIDALDNCIGLLIDLTKAVCISCPVQEDCRKQFAQHAADGFKIFNTLQPDVVPVEALSKKAKKEADKIGTTKLVIQNFKKVSGLPVIKMGDDEVDNIEHKEFLRVLRDEKPADRGAFNTLVLSKYDPAEDDKGGAKLTQWFFDYTQKLGVVAA